MAAPPERHMGRCSATVEQPTVDGIAGFGGFWTNSEGQVKYFRCTFFWTCHAGSRVPTASNVGSRDVTWASQPTPLIPLSRLFACFAGRIPEARNFYFAANPCDQEGLRQRT